MQASEINEARNAALREHKGQKITAAEKRLISRVVDSVGPEMFYMDGELFCDGGW